MYTCLRTKGLMARVSSRPGAKALLRRPRLTGTRQDMQIDAYAYVSWIRIRLQRFWALYLRSLNEQEGFINKHPSWIFLQQITALDSYMASLGRTWSYIGAKDLLDDDNVVWIANGMSLPPGTPVSSTSNCYKISNGVIGTYSCDNAYGSYVCEQYP